jgi:lysophospholipase L1-like esterase
MQNRFLLKLCFTAIGCAFCFNSLMADHHKENLPQVLIIGDSISMGYTPVLQGMLYGKVDITRPPNSGGGWINCEGTKRGVEMIDEWLALGDFDVIHFNFGLHDLKHVQPDSGRNSNDPSHPQQSNLKQYDANLRLIVAKLKATGAKLIFATTTPYPDNPGGPLRRANQPLKYNKVALKIMKENGIDVNDLHGFTLPRMDELLLPNNVHFRPEANLELAKKVAKSIKGSFE